MKVCNPFLLGLLFVAAYGPIAASAQTEPGVQSKYLQVIVEYTKPDKGGLTHDKTETALAEAMRRAKFPIRYTGYTAMTGKPRSIYISRFDSFEDLQKAFGAVASPEIDRLTYVDGQNLEDSKSLIFKSLPDLSYHSISPGPKQRVMEANVFLVKPGHAKDFEELVKRVKAIDDKIGSSSHWGAYRILYGEAAGSYALLTSSTTTADIDTRLGEDPKFEAAVGEEENKKLDELRAASIESSHREMYVANPAQSYVPDDWTQADPFWKLKGAGAAAPKPAAAEKKP